MSFIKCCLKCYVWKAIHLCMCQPILYTAPGILPLASVSWVSSLIYPYNIYPQYYIWMQKSGVRPNTPYPYTSSEDIHLKTCQEHQLMFHSYTAHHCHIHGFVYVHYLPLRNYFRDISKRKRRGYEWTSWIEPNPFYHKPFQLVIFSKS